MKALTLHQPWASLGALGVKTIETRSWSTSYRGPLAIHAAKKRPDFAAMKRLVVDDLTAWNAWYAAGLVAEDGSLDFMPLGAVVATCTLTDVVPIRHDDDDLDGPRVATVNDKRYSRDDVYLWEPATIQPSRIENEAIVPDGEQFDGWQRTRTFYDQRPYGDFTPGRFAWLLDNIVALDEPVPARGRQRLWEWAA